MVSEGVLISGTIIQIPSHVHPQKHRREVRLLRESEEHRVWTSPDSGQELCRKNSACSWHKELFMFAVCALSIKVLLHLVMIT
ncbi:unnamed protein product [Brassica oleracea var. botrytis]